jgi:hypothetical protein
MSGAAQTRWRRGAGGRRARVRAGREEEGSIAVAFLCRSPSERGREGELGTGEKEGEKKREKGDDDWRRDHHHRLAAHLIRPHVSLASTSP